MISPILILILALIFTIILTSLFYHKKIIDWFKVHKKLGAALITIMVAAPTGALLYLGDQPIEPPVIIDAEAFIWIPASGYGSMPHWEVNRTYAKQFLKDNFKWRLQASGDNITWSDANQLLNIGLDWNDADISYKVTLTLNTTLAPKALYYRFDLACNKSLKQYLETDGYEWQLTVPANNTKDYTLLFNWSDIKSLVQSGKVWFDRDVKDNFFWFRIQTVNKIAVDKLFVVDPVYGIMPAAVTDSEEWDGADGWVENLNAFIRLGTSNYFMTSAKGTLEDGFLTVIQVNDSGTINDNVISEWEYDISDGTYAGITHINDDIYAVYYLDSATGVLFTTRAWSSNGTLQKTIIDTQNFAYKPCASSLIHVSGDIYAAIYQEYGGGYDHQIETFEITSTGDISAQKDIVEFDATSTTNTFGNCHAVMVDSDTIAIVWYESVGYDDWLVTYNISSAGDITNNIADIWEFDSTPTYDSPVYIHHISGNVFAITYTGADTDGFTKTVTIADTGAITKSFIDTLEWGAGNTVFYPSMFTVADASVYGIIFQDVSADGQLYTINITSAGAMDAAKIDGLEFETADNNYYALCIHVAGDIYVICYTSTGNDGWAKTVEILTNWASSTFSSPSPTNASINQTLTPQCAITVNDLNGDLMTVNFYENSTGPYVLRQTNSSCANGTYRWTDAQATANNHKYWWKVYANDGTHNVSEWYCFTTVAGGGTTYNVTVRNDGLDYFVWLSTNTSAYFVGKNITGFDEATEYVAIWKNTTWNNSYGAWQRYFGDKTGINFTIHTFDVVEVYLTDAGTQTFNMSENIHVNYTNSKAINLINSTNLGYNFSAYNKITPTTLSAINTSLDLPEGYFIALWNETNYNWDYWIIGFQETDKTVLQWDVIYTIVDETKVWNT